MKNNYIQVLKLFFLILVNFQIDLYSKGTRANIILTNVAMVTSENDLPVFSLPANVTVATVFGLSALTDPPDQQAVPSMTVYFRYTFTNKSNWDDDGIVIRLLDFYTNDSYQSGNWIAKIYDINYNVIGTGAKQSQDPTSVCFYRVPRLAEDATFDFLVGVQIPINAQFGAWGYVPVEIYTENSNKAGPYQGENFEWYGGAKRTNDINPPGTDPGLGMHSVITCILPVVVNLTKSVYKITNIDGRNNYPVPGAEIIYELKYTNQGPGLATNLVIIDYLPPRDTTFVPALPRVEFVVGSIDLTGVHPGAQFNVYYSNDNGFSWLYVPVGKYDSNVTALKFVSTGRGVENRQSGRIRFKIRIAK